MDFIIDVKMELMAIIEDVFAGYVSENYSMACQKSCSTCCTKDVVTTSLEAYRVLEALREDQDQDILNRLREATALDLFRPKITTNALAMACMSHEEPPFEAPPEDSGQCPLLKDDLCLVYDVRPFSCRGMFALTKCVPGGEAELPPELISIVTVCWQIIEHLDVGGLYGNFFDLVKVLEDKNNHLKYSTGDQIIVKGLAPTRPVPGLLVPPDHVEIVNMFLTRLFNRECRGDQFRKIMSGLRNSPF